MLRVTKKFYRILDAVQQKKAIVIIVLMLLGGIMESLSVSLIVPLITAVMDAEGWNQKWYAAMICNFFHISSQKTYIEVLLVMLILVFLLKNVYLLLEYYIQYSFIARSRYQLQHNLMHRYTHKPYIFYLNSNSGEIMRIITGDTAQTFTLLTNVLLFYTEAIVSIILAVTVFAMSPEIAVGLIVVLALEVLVISKIIKPVMRINGAKQRSENAAANKWILQALNGIKSIKVANTEKFFEEKYCEHAESVVEVDRRYQTLGNVPRLLIEAFTMAAVLILILIMVLTGTELATIVPQLSAFVVAAVRLLPSVNRISTAINQVPFLEGGLDNVIKTLSLEENTSDVQKSEGEREISFEEAIVLKDLSFKYPDSEQWILKNANVTIHCGESIGIIGNSGAGKTTAVDILLGLLKPQQGCVLVDGRNIERNMSLWLSHLAYIPQQIFLMDDTIRENVAFGFHRSEIDDAKVWDALREAQLYDFVKTLPEGLDTEIGEAGVRLSGGQRQRIGIARALYNDPDILFFDEATSALDNDTESAIMESIDSLKGRKTMIIIAHRLSTIENCDLVYRVENGKIQKEGKPK